MTKSLPSSLPSLFVGSSTRGLKIAEAVKAQLAGKANVRLWNEDVFRLGDHLLEGLIAALDIFDFAVMIITPDVLVNSDNKTYNSPRDNVLFELGLFMGRIGRGRTFIIDQNSPSLELKLPSDLEGIIRSKYKMYKRQPDVRLACTSIKDAIQRLGRRERHVQTFNDVNAAFNALRDDIRTGKLKPRGAELIQHSSDRASELVKALARKQTNIQLYLQHPETLNTVCSDLKTRVTTRLDVYPHELKSQRYRGNLQIYLYKTPASFDGIKLWKADGTTLVVMGWYTYHSDGPLKDLTESKFRGSENPCFMIDNTHPQYGYFESFFDRLVNSCKTQGTPPVFQMQKGECTWLPGWPVRPTTVQTGGTALTGARLNNTDRTLS